MLLGASAAHATAGIDEVLSLTATWSYSAQAGTAAHSGSGNTSVFTINKTYTAVPGGPSLLSQVHVDYDAMVASGGAFHFLQDGQCLGNCDIQLKVLIVDKVTNNTGAAASDLRFDSQITPGHVGLQGQDVGGLANFNFSVSQKNGLSGPNLTLYSASASTSTGDTGSISALNGLNLYENGGEFAYDWGATNIFVPLNTIAAGETATVTYRSEVLVQSRGSCTDLVVCAGAQVVFGDPRNTGSVTYSGLGSGGSPVNYVLGQPYDPYNSFAHIVLNTDPKPGDGLPPPLVTYTPGPFAASVPEPATWAMLLTGFGLTGAVARRRKSLAARAA